MDVSLPTKGPSNCSCSDEEEEVGSKDASDNLFSGQEIDKEESKKQQHSSTPHAGKTRLVVVQPVTPSVDCGSTTKHGNEDENVSSRALKRRKKESKKKPIDGVGAKEGMKTRDEPKKQLCERLWSDTDVIKILKGLLEYPKDGLEDKAGFYNFMKNSFSFKATRAQLESKIRKIKRKYKTNLEKGDSRKLGDSHNEELFNLSRKMWGGVDNAANEFGKHPKKHLKEETGIAIISPGATGNCCIETIPFDKIASFSSSEDVVVKQAWHNLGLEEREKLVNKWKKICSNRMKVLSQEFKFMHDATEMMYAAFN